MDSVEKSMQKLRIDEGIQFLEKMRREIDCDIKILNRAFEGVDKGDVDIRSKSSLMTTFLAEDTRKILIRISDFKASMSAFSGKASFYFSEKLDK